MRFGGCQPWSAQPHRACGPRSAPTRSSQQRGSINRARPTTRATRCAPGSLQSACLRPARQRGRAPGWTTHGAGACPALQQMLRPALCSRAGITVQQAARHTGHAGILQALGQGLQLHRATGTGARLVREQGRLDRGHGFSVVGQRTLGTGGVQRDGACFNQVRQRLGQLRPRRTHRLQQAAQWMTRTMPGPAAQLLAPPCQLGIGRQRIAAGIEHVVELLQQREPRHGKLALRFGHERGGHRPFRPTAAPLVEETVQRGTAHYVIPYGWAGAAGRVGQRLASCRSSAFSTSTSACQASGSSLCRR